MRIRNLWKGILLGLGLVVAGTANAGFVNAEGRMAARMDDHVVSVPVQGEELLREASEQGIGVSYQKKDFTALTKDGKLSLQVPEGVAVTQAEDTTAGGMRYTASKGAFDQTRYVIADSYEFGENVVGRLVFDGLADKGKKVNVRFFIDDAEEPFATVPLTCVKRSKKWNLEKPITHDISAVGLSGTHRLSFQIDFQSEDAAEETTVVLRSVEFIRNTIPVVYFDIDETQGTIAAMNSDDKHDTECYGNMTIQVPAGYVSEYSDKELATETYSLEYIRGRGNSTWMVEKKPYKIKLDKKAGLLGMKKNKHWALIANYYDNSLLRNKATYFAGSKLGLEFTPESEFVDVVMNGEYLGSYMLCEQIRVDKNRVDIDDLEDTDELKAATDPAIISGGYLLSMFPYGDEEGKVIRTSHNQEFLIESPSFEGYENEAQYKYISDYVQRTEDAIYGTGFKTEDGVSYADLLDVNSAIDYYWMQEFSMNGDGFLSTSTYLYKKRDGKLYWGPLWDFDFVAWGAYEFDGHNVEGFVHNYSTWYDRLFSDKAFADAVIARWPAFKEQMLNLCKDGGQIDLYKKQLAESAYYNTEKWGLRETDDYFGGGSAIENMTYDSEVERFKEWIRQRIAWIDENINQLQVNEYKVTFTVDGEVYAERTASSREPLRDFPPEPEKKGYIFSGWYETVFEDDYSYEVPYQAGETFLADAVLHPNWILPSDVVEVSDVVMLRTEKTMAIWEESAYIEAQAIPLDATFQTLTWSVDNADVAEVDEYGCLTFKNVGDVKVTATAPNGKSATCLLHVVMDFTDYDSDFELSTEEMRLKEGETGVLGIEAFPVTAPDGNYMFYCSDSSVASVFSSGVVYAEHSGEAIIIVINQQTGVLRTCKLIVSPSGDSVGTKFTVGGNIYKVTKNNDSGKEVAFVGVKKSASKISIPATVSNNGAQYKVTSISNNALKGKKNLKKVEIGKNVKKIGRNAFKDCKKLKSIIVRSSKLKKIGKDAFSGIDKKAAAYVPAKKLKDYTKLFSKYGVKKVITVKKIPVKPIAISSER